MTYIRKIFSDTLIYSLGNIINRFLAFLLLPLYTHFFIPEDYGIYSIVYSFWFFAAVIYLYGMETAVQKFFLDAKVLGQQRKIYGSSLVVIFVTSLIFSSVIYLFSEQLSVMLTGSNVSSGLIKILALILIIDSLSRFPMIILNSLQQSMRYTIINISTVILNITANIIFIIGLGYGIEAIFYSFLISYSFQFIVSFVLTVKYFSINIDVPLLKKLLKYSHNFIYYGVFLISLDLIDRILLGNLVSNEAAGIYSASYRLAMVMNLLISGFRTAWFPFFMKLKNNEDNKKIFSSVFTYFNLFGIIIFVLFSLFAEEIVTIRFNDFYLLDPDYRSGLIIVPFILIAYLFFGLYTNLIITSFYENKINYLLWSSGIAAILNILLNLILIPIYSYLGAAIATAAAYMIMFLILYYLSQKDFYIRYEWKKILIIWTTGVIFVIIEFLLEYLEVCYSILISYKILSVLIILIFLWFNKLLRKIPYKLS